MGYFTTNIPAWGNLFPPAPFDKLVTSKGIQTPKSSKIPPEMSHLNFEANL